MAVTGRTIGIVAGGAGGEAEYSWRAGRLVHQTLVRQGFRCALIDAGPGLVEALGREGVAIVYNLSYGHPGQDGTLQGILDAMGLPYTGSGLVATAVARDKALTKRLVRDAGIATPAFDLIRRPEWELEPGRFPERCRRLGFPLVCKPNRNAGLSQGVVPLGSEAELGGPGFPSSLSSLFALDSEVLLERWVEGAELWVGVIGERPPRTLPPAQVVAEGGGNDTRAKVAGRRRLVVPAPVDAAAAALAERWACELYGLLGCRGLAYVEFILEAGRTPQFIEVGTVVGLTEVSNFPQVAAQVGLLYDGLVTLPLRLAIDDWGLGWALDDLRRG